MRELTVLGTASQVPTRHRNHNGYLLRWDTESILFDPGEGTQRQMLMAGASASELTRIAITHFHGDHSLGLPGVIQRISLDQVPHPVFAHYPAGGQEFFDRLRHATSFYDTADLRPEPVAGGFAVDTPVGRFEALPLEHAIETYGYRLVEPDGRRMLPELLRAYGIDGPAIGELQRAGHLDRDGDRVTLEQVSVPRPGQRFAFIMDTGLCDNVFALAQGADLLVIESTFLADGGGAGGAGRAPDRRPGRAGGARVRGTHARAHPLLPAVRRRHPVPRRGPATLLRADRGGRGPDAGAGARPAARAAVPGRSPRRR